MMILFSILLNIFLMILIIILMILFLILLIPFKYSLSVMINEKSKFYVYLDWAVLRVEFLMEEMKPFVKIYIMRRVILYKLLEKYPSKIKSKKQSLKHPVRKPQKSRFKMPGTTFFKEMFLLLKDVLNVIRPKEIKAVGSYSFDDPALTALVNFIITVINDAIPSAEIWVNPLFDEDTTDVEINISGSIVLIKFVYIFLKYIFKKEVRNVLFQKRRKIENLNQI
jgi:hypothetical protein